MKSFDGHVDARLTALNKSLNEVCSQTVAAGAVAVCCCWHYHH